MTQSYLILQPLSKLLHVCFYICCLNFKDLSYFIFLLIFLWHLSLSLNDQGKMTWDFMKLCLWGFVHFCASFPEFFSGGLSTGLTYSTERGRRRRPSGELTVERSTPAVTEHMTSLSQNSLWPSLLYSFNYAVVIFFSSKLNFHFTDVENIAVN